jgi:DNA-directed RNA polymerase subunit RPC12/RpoP
MKIIKRGVEKEIICPKCHSTLLYDIEDVHLAGDMEGEYNYCVTCPECGERIVVEVNN